MVRGKLPPIRWAWIAAGVVTAVAVIALFAFRSRPAEATPVAFSEFLSDVNANRVKSVVSRPTRFVSSGAMARCSRRRRRPATSPSIRRSSPGCSSAACTSARRRSVTTEELYQTLGIGLFVFAIAGLVLFRATGRVTTLEKVRAVDPDNVPVTFNDVAGVDEAKDEVRRSSIS